METMFIWKFVMGLYDNVQVLPFTQDIYKPMLTRLKTEGITASEKSTFLN